MPEWAKKIIWTLVVCFIIYYIVTQPEQFAYGVKSIVHSVARIFHALSH